MTVKDLLPKHIILALSEIGRVAFVAIIFFGFLSVILELVYPGFVINWIAPKTIIGLAVLFGALSFLPSDQVVRRGFSWFWALSFSLLAGVMAFLATWGYFSIISEIRLLISITTALVASSSCWLLTYNRYFGSVNK